MVPIKDLKPHPRNYREHPEDQIEHLRQSINDNGFYRNVVIAKDSTILAGHGITEAMQGLKYKQVPCYRLDIEPDSPQALKILAGDNYISHFANDDDRVLSEILKEIYTEDDLLGTGFTDEAVAVLAMVTRDANELADFDAAAEWLGMPTYETKEEYDERAPERKLIVLCDTEDDRTKALDLLGCMIVTGKGKTASTRFPPRQSVEDAVTLRFTTDGDEEE